MIVERMITEIRCIMHRIFCKYLFMIGIAEFWRAKFSTRLIMGLSKLIAHKMIDRGLAVYFR